LPSVWEDIRDPYVFLTQLKQKAGLPLDFWSDEMKTERYTTESFGDSDLT
jgi:AMMECR1 domain-containing protein